ncbi:MAG TPA: rhomboid family intramembrane serine protease [Rhodobacteraceae bacterium]|nr:rhomboid family intramembrane serine protease [Paracoccaceae bacterium]
MFPIRDHNPSTRTPYITYVLVAANIGVFLSYVALFGDERALFELFWTWGAVPVKISHGVGLEGIFTSMFLHASFMHLAGNMLFLWIFGDNLEDKLGHLGYLVFYFASGLGAVALQIAVEPMSNVPIVGASGAIAGVMGGYLLLFPRARIDVLIIIVVFFKIFPVPAWIMLALWFVFQVFNGTINPADGGGVAHWAHAGGFIVGLIGVVPVWLKAGGPAFWARTEGHPDHPEARYRATRSRVPSVRRRR